MPSRKPRGMVAEEEEVHSHAQADASLAPSHCSGEPCQILSIFPMMPKLKNVNRWIGSQRSPLLSSPAQEHSRGVGVLICLQIIASMWLGMLCCKFPCFEMRLYSSSVCDFLGYGDCLACPQDRTVCMPIFRTFLVIKRPAPLSSLLCLIFQTSATSSRRRFLAHLALEGRDGRHGDLCGNRPFQAPAGAATPVGF